MSAQLRFFTHPMSRGRTVRWMLEEIGAPYETDIIGYGAAMKAPAYLAINPMGKVPAIQHGDIIVTECAAILAYLADAFPDAQLAPPPTSPQRGPYYRWLFFGAGCVEPAASSKMLDITPTVEQQAMVGFGSLNAVMDTLDQALSETPEFLTGSQFTAADLYIGSQLEWLTSFGVFEKRESFVTFIARATNREAYRRANAADDKVLKDQPDLIPEAMRGQFN